MPNLKYNVSEATVALVLGLNLKQPFYEDGLVHGGPVLPHVGLHDVETDVGDSRRVTLRYAPFMKGLECH